MAASMGYDPITTLAHRMEDVVEAQRRTKRAFAHATTDCLLRAVDALSAQVECVAEERPLPLHIELVRELNVIVASLSSAGPEVETVAAPTPDAPAAAAPESK